MGTVINPVEKSMSRIWIERAMYALLIAGVTISLLMAATAVIQEFFNAPPIKIKSLDPEKLGSFCPGTSVPIHNQVSINDNIIVFYYISTLDEGADSNYIGTQRAYVDMLHPAPALFRLEIPWLVPELPAGQYTRVFAVRNVGANQDVVFVVASYAIREGC